MRQWLVICRGGPRAGSGRKSKALAEKIESGNPGGRKLTVVSMRDLDLVTIGMVNDMYAESRNDEYKGYREIATQEDMDLF